MSEVVLVADDSDSTRTAIVEQLRLLGVSKILEASDGEMAYLMYQRVKPAFVTLDIAMPKVDGLATLKNIKRYDPKAKVIMVSAHGSSEKVIEAFNLGAIDFIVKPFKPDRLASIIKRIVKKY